MRLHQYREIWHVDFEYTSRKGERPAPICVVALEAKSGRELRIWQDELLLMRQPPYSTDKEALFVCYLATAELGCHLVLNWPLPENVLDLYVEFSWLTNGLSRPHGRSLLGAMQWFGLDGIGVVEKESMRALANRGGPWTEDERNGLLEYCESDVQALVRLLPCMAPHLDLPRAIRLRGRYMKALARIEDRGIPIDTEALELFRTHWEEVQEDVIREIDTSYQVYEGRVFKQERFAAWLEKNGMTWPRTQTGRLCLDDQTFKDMSRIHPIVASLHELRISLAKLRSDSLTVGRDGRNRCMLSPFGAVSSRNTPSSTKYIFGSAVWFRGLIKPGPGYALVYLDFEQQEFGIAAALSGDEAMIQAYETGDAYLAFAKQAGAVPDNATKQSHGVQREQFKECSLAVQYGMKAISLGARLNLPPVYAEELLRAHRRTYKQFWGWSDRGQDYAALYGNLWTVFGWVLRSGPQIKPNTFRNFPMQGNGAEMLRLACCLAAEKGVRVCGPVHDALLVEAPLEEVDDVLAVTQQAMVKASNLVLDGFDLRIEAKIIRYPDRFMDKRGERMWQKVWGSIQRKRSNSTT